TGNYLSVEATPIIRLLMGKTFYGGVENIWFRELLQNALDANGTRASLDPTASKSKIWIRRNGVRSVVIRDNGIGMSYQHILRYLTTLGRSIWSSDELEDAGSKETRQVTIGKFGIGFVSVFQAAERVIVRTRFFREDEATGWAVDFTSI